MVALQGRDRGQLRFTVGMNLGVVKEIEADATGTTTTLKTDDIFGAADEHNGKWLVLTKGTNNDGQIRRVTDSSITSNQTTLTFYPAVTDAPADGDTGELWDQGADPAVVHEHINQAIIEATGLYFDPEESLALHADSRQMRFDLPAEFIMLNKVQYRSKVTSKVIHQCDRTWDEKTDADFTVSVDTKDYKQKSSVKIVVVAAASAGDSISDSIDSIDLSAYDYVEFWIKSTVATAAADLQLLLDNTASVASPLETLDVPALTADTWTYVRVALSTPELDTAIISVGLKYTVDIGAATIWLDDIKAVDNSSALWHTLDKNSWRVDSEARDLLLTNAGRLEAGYHLLKLIGGDKPALLTTEGGATEVPDDFVIARATELSALTMGGGPNTDPDARRALAAYWGQRAAQAKRRFPMLTNVRLVG